MARGRSLAYVTDHRFVLGQDCVLDRFGFDRDFFAPFVGRFASSDSQGVERTIPAVAGTLHNTGVPVGDFVDLGGASGARWLLGACRRVGLLV